MRRLPTAGVMGAALLLLVACNRRDAAQPQAVDEVGSVPMLAQSPTLASLLPATVNLVDLARPAEPKACGAGMVLVEGEYCPEVEQRCLKYMDPPGRFEFFRCAEYAQPARCLSPKKKMRFCMDRSEYVKPGETLPANDQSWTDGDRTCRGLGKRMCMESEYNFACEGEEMRPYPYGFKRDASACNADHTDVVSPEGKLRDMRVTADEYPRCESPFGVKHLAGNLEEFVSIDNSTPVRPAMKGAYWQPSRNFCRAAQTAHDRYYHGTETGFRCCSDAK
ncbi:MAG: SUMF1/EgtB/PvdO family nonheme iron enzyme [Myxococcales bacterium]|nr:SUMF1/EgtB/PvdO family nonheme iron enzyme [Myxococcales bacterium]